MFFREFRDSQLPPKRPVQQRLEEMLGLALGFALLGAQPLEFVDRSLKHEWYERTRNARKPFVCFVFFRGFRDSQLLPKRPVQQCLEQMLRVALGFALLGAQPLELVDDLGEFLLEGERGNGNSYGHKMYGPNP